MSVIIGLIFKLYILGIVSGLENPPYYTSDIWTYFKRKQKSIDTKSIRLFKQPRNFNLLVGIGAFDVVDLDLVGPASVGDGGGDGEHASVASGASLNIH